MLKAFKALIIVLISNIQYCRVETFFTLRRISLLLDDKGSYIIFLCLTKILLFGSIKLPWQKNTYVYIVRNKFTIFIAIITKKLNHLQETAKNSMEHFV